MNYFFIMTLLLSSSLWAQKVAVPTEAIKADLINSSALGVGSVQQSVLSVVQFTNLNGSCWRLMDGSAISGTQLADLTGWTHLPKLNEEGQFLRQATATTPVGTFQGDAIRNITGTFGAEGLSRDTGESSASGALYHEARAHRAYGATGYVGAARIGLDASRVVPTASENRPKNFSLNFFIKVSNACSFN